MLFRETSWEEYPSLTMSARWSDLVDFYRENQNATHCTIVDADHYPIGLISLQRYQSLVASPFGHALNQRKGVLELMNETFLSAALNENAEIVFSKFQDTQQLLHDGLVLTDEKGRYVGGLNSRSVLTCLNHIHARVLKSLQAQIIERESIERQIRTPRGYGSADLNPESPGICSRDRRFD